MNHLKHEKSPYLLQHAENPVDWYPWCEEAFALAAEKDLPIFLSIGYSTCHWCHVMAHESFEDEEVAAFLTDHFISIKVDREERPDVDSVYMRAAQAMTGSGGWPLTIFMTPEKTPFFAGTYFPKHTKYGQIGLLELLSAVSQKWHEDRDSLLAQGSQVVSFLQNQEAAAPQSKQNPENSIAEALSHFTKTFDRKYGGFGSSPKFPAAHNLLFLMAQKSKKGDKYLAMAEKTLTQMYLGGIFDHIGGGFCRYSTDDMWLVPHFEKMLYDNAMLLMAYSQCYYETKSPLYLTIANKTAVYMLRELKDSDGGFYCGQDADSDGKEGTYYLFTPEEVRSVLHLEPAAAFCSQYDITPQGNFMGKNIPNLLRAKDHGLLPDEDVLRILYDYRLERTQLHKDDKVLTSWNGLAIAALAKAARQLKNADYLEASLSAADFIWNHLQDEGKLFARWRQGHYAFAGTLDDYAFYIWGLLECYSTTFNPIFLERADRIGRTMIKLFFDSREGGCYLYAADSEALFLRPKETYDGAMPSGNSVAAHVMKKLAFLTGENFWEEAAEKQSAFMDRACSDYPFGNSFYLWSVSQDIFEEGKLICTMPDAENLSADTLCRLWDLQMDVVLKTKKTEETLHRVSPYLKNYEIPAEGSDFYLCRNHVCFSPVHSLDALESL